MTEHKPASHNIEVWIAIATVLGISVHLFLRWGPLGAEYQNVPLFVVLALGGTPLVYQLLRQVVKREFGADLLAGIAIVTAVVLEEYLAGSIVVLMLSGGETLEAWAMGRASSVLAALAKRMPQQAHVRGPDGELTHVEVSSVEVGNTVVILPNEIAPVDGEVIEGHGSMDESYLTGEPYEVSKAPGSVVLSGAINKDNQIVIRATRRATDSRYARIMEVMAEAQQSRPKIRRLADQLGALYTPVAVSIAAAAWALSGDPTRFLAVLVVATPCPLLIAIPTALVGAISLAARRSIIIRDTRVLEQIDQCDTLILDKTGTLTLGKPSMTSMEVAETFDEDEVLRLTASVEQFSRHPLAVAILEAARGRDLDLTKVDSLSEKPGEGLTARVLDRSVHITSRNKLERAGHPDHHKIPEVESGLECVVLIDDAYAATLRFHDEPRHEGPAFIAHLKPLHAFKRVMIVSGDRQSEVNYLAEKVGIEEVYAERSPEEKVEIVREATRHSRTIFVGDGVNDAPALMSATVGIAMGNAHEVTAESAGAVIMEPSLVRVDQLIHIGSRFRRIALQSALGGMALSLVGMGFAAFGFLPPVAGALVQEGIDLAAIANSLRVAFTRDSLSDVETKDSRSA